MRSKGGLDHSRKVKAVRVMGQDEACWCESGDKWIDCHKGRQRERRRNFKESVSNINREYAKGYCSHPDAPVGCSNKTIKAHSIQRSTGLRGIAEDSHVYSARGRLQENGIREIIKVGVNDASTFPGFCGVHDNAMFKPIETSPIHFTRETSFLFSYRALALEVFTRRAGLRGLHRNRLDAGYDLKGQEAHVNQLRMHMLPLRVGLDDLGKWKDDLDAIYKDRDFSTVKGVMVRFDGILPVAASSAIQPWFDFEGNEIQELDKIEETSQLSYTITQDDGESIIVFGWDRDKQKASRALVDAFLAIPDNQKATAACLLAFAYGENTFFQMSWWDALYEMQQNRVRLTMSFATGGLEDRGQQRQVMNPKVSPFGVAIGVKEIVVID